MAWRTFGNLTLMRRRLRGGPAPPPLPLAEHLQPRIGSRRGLIKSLQDPGRESLAAQKKRNEEKKKRRKGKKKRKEKNRKGKKRKATRWKRSGFPSREISSISDPTTPKIPQIRLEKLIKLSCFQLVGGEPHREPDREPRVRKASRAATYTKIPACT